MSIEFDEVEILVTPPIAEVELGIPGPVGSAGASAYEIAVENGFVGTEEEWLASLGGGAGSGADGASAYEIAVANGFVGTEGEWLASLVGAPGAPGAPGSDATVTQESIVAALGADPVLEGDPRLTDVRPPTAHNHDALYDPLGAAAAAQAAAATDATTKANAAQSAAIAAAAADATGKIDAIKDGVAADGDTLAKLRGLIQGIQTLLTSDNINLDTLQEVVDFVELHQSELDSLGAGKVNVSDIINALTDTSSNKPLAAAQGKVLKDALDALTAVVAGKQAAGNYIVEGDTRLSDAREWTAETVSQPEAEAGTATTRRAWTAQRDRQAIEASPVRGSLDLRTANVTLAQSSNYIVNSENFSTANISPSRALVRSTGVLAPNDTLTAERITDTTSVNQQSRIIFVAPTFGSSATVNMSIFVKPFGNITHVSLYPSNAGVGSLISFDLTTLTATVNNVSGGVGAGEIRQHKNGYFRLSVALTLPAPVTSINTWLYFAPGPTGNTSYTGDGNSGVDIWGLQVTPGLATLPYVRTSGSALENVSQLHSAGTLRHTAPLSSFEGLVNISANSTDAALKVTQAGAGHCLVVEDQAGDTTPFVIDGSGIVLLGFSNRMSVPLSSSTLGIPKLQTAGTTQEMAANLQVAHSDIPTVAPNALLGRTRGSAESSSACQSGDATGRLIFLGFDGQSPGTNAGFIRSAQITSEIDGDVANGAMPGRLVFSTTPSGSNTPVEALRITSGQGIQIARTAVAAPAASDGNVFSGTYTPTLTNVTNVSASTAFSCQYMRVGNTVTVSGQVEITPTAANAHTLLGISLPIASSFGASRQCRGSSCMETTAASEIQLGNGGVSADTTNNRAQLRCAPSTTNNRAHSFTFTYLVI